MRFQERKKLPNFRRVTLFCEYRSRAKKCPFVLLAVRPNVENGEIDVYAYQEHNHVILPAIKRAVYRIQPNVIIADENPPSKFTSAEGLEWRYQTTVADFWAFNDYRTGMYCRKPNFNRTDRAQLRVTCLTNYKRRNKHCPFKLFGKKTTKCRYHVYTNGEHNCVGWQQRKQLESINDNGDVEDDHIVANPIDETADQPISLEAGSNNKPEHYSNEKIQQRLARALREGNVTRVCKWMDRTEAKQIGQILSALDDQELTMLVEMADSQMRANRESMHIWQPWVHALLQLDGRQRIVELMKFPQFAAQMNSLLQFYHAQAAAFPLDQLLQLQARLNAMIEQMALTSSDDEHDDDDGRRGRRMMMR